MTITLTLDEYAAINAALSQGAELISGNYCSHDALKGPCSADNTFCSAQMQLQAQKILNDAYERAK